MNSKTFQWTIVGAGPAGIATIGKLLDAGIAGKDILWIDPKFTVGDLGLCWQNVSSNTKVKLFKKFLFASPSFEYSLTAPYVLNKYDDEKTCLLKDIVKPLQQITQNLRKKVDSFQGILESLALRSNKWQLTFKDKQKTESANVVLAVGAEPLNSSSKIPIIPFATAIDPILLKKEFSKHHTYAVFGSSHSAIIMLKNLIDLNAKRIINFYRSPCCYAVEVGSAILYDNTGLKGDSATWAKQYIDGNLPNNLERYLSNQQNLDLYLPQCDKAIYAVGFKPRDSVIIEGYDSSKYNKQLGIIAPGLFGIGFAYPEVKQDTFGITESRVGLWKFMEHIERILPIWCKYSA